VRANSLALRLFLSATAWIVVILVVTGIVLSSLYRHAVERAFDRRLGVYLKTLVADIASPDEQSAERFPQSLSEPLFELPLSGWYWQVTRLDTARPELRSSRSLWDSARTHVGNLAHALKTPISVMMNEAASHTQGPLSDKVREQTEIMRDQVARHLERAR